MFPPSEKYSNHNKHTMSDHDKGRDKNQGDVGFQIAGTIVYVLLLAAGFLLFLLLIMALSGGNHNSLVGSALGF